MFTLGRHSGHGKLFHGAVVAGNPFGAGRVHERARSGRRHSLARPGANATGFTNSEYGISGKWLELLKEIAPGVTRVAVIRDPALSAGIGQFGAIRRRWSDVLRFRPS